MSKVKIFVRELYWLFQDNAEEVLSQYTFKLFCHWYLSRILLSRIGLKSDFLGQTAALQFLLKHRGHLFCAVFTTDRHHKLECGPPSRRFFAQLLQFIARPQHDHLPLSSSHQWCCIFPKSLSPCRGSSSRDTHRQRRQQVLTRRLQGSSPSPV